ncbi:phage major capsid protein [Mycolicibacterium litorale]|uniref:phage major capsid protein n=1 Tax=Mycolicibacterium litorale TaxID=758802 RepID=UPI003CE8890F
MATLSSQKRVDGHPDRFDDSSPDAGKVIGDGLARDISRKLDAALFTATTAKGPSGLPSLTGIVAATAASMAALPDTLIGTTYTLEANHASPMNWVAHPDTAARISSLKKATGSNEPLLGNDVSVPGKRTLFGAPLLTSPYVAANVVWGVDKTCSRRVV